MHDDTTLSRTSRFWDCEAVTPTHNSWMAHPEIRSYINESISGSPHQWPIDWLVEWLAGRRFTRALSIGCGTGPLERDLVQRDLCDSIDAFDGSPESVRIARGLAEQAGMGRRINYYLADFNEPRLPSRTYDIVLFHQSAHHVSKLEKLYSAVLRSLKRNGLVYFDEYIGPSRFDWNEDLIAQHRQFYARISPRPGYRILSPFPFIRSIPRKLFARAKSFLNSDMDFEFSRFGITVDHFCPCSFQRLIGQRRRRSMSPT